MNDVHSGLGCTFFCFKMYRCATFITFQHKYIKKVEKDIVDKDEKRCYNKKAVGDGSRGEARVSEEDLNAGKDV